MDTTLADEYERPPKRVDECFDHLREAGYFRDPYNGWDVLWHFGLSWWYNIIPLLDADRNLSVSNIKKVLAMLDQYQAVFDDDVRECTPEDHEYFEGQAKALRQFLRQAIELNEPIACSL